MACGCNRRRNCRVTPLALNLLLLFFAGLVADYKNGYGAAKPDGLTSKRAHSRNVDKAGISQGTHKAGLSN